MKTSLKICIPLLFATLAACTSLVDYQPKAIADPASAKETVERLTMTQAPEWKPDYIEFKETYIEWGWGFVSEHKGHTMFEDAKTSTKSSSERLYFTDVKDFRLMSWVPKGRQWYIVASVNKQDDVKYLLRTRHKVVAQEYFDAVRSVTGFDTR